MTYNILYQDELGRLHIFATLNGKLRKRYPKTKKSWTKKWINSKMLICPWCYTEFEFKENNPSTILNSSSFLPCQESGAPEGAQRSISVVCTQCERSTLWGIRSKQQLLQTKKLLNIERRDRWGTYYTYSYSDACLP